MSMTAEEREIAHEMRRRLEEASTVHKALADELEARAEELRGARILVRDKDTEIQRLTKVNGDLRKELADVTNHRDRLSNEKATVWGQVVQRPERETPEALRDPRGGDEQC